MQTKMECNIILLERIKMYKKKFYFRLNRDIQAWEPGNAMNP